MDSGINVVSKSVDQQSEDIGKEDGVPEVKVGGIMYYYNVVDIDGVVIREQAPFDEDNRSRLKEGNVFNLVFKKKEETFVITNVFPLCEGIGTVIVDRF